MGGEREVVFWGRGVRLRGVGGDGDDGTWRSCAGLYIWGSVSYYGYWVMLPSYG